MILVDTSVWLDHLAGSDPVMANLLVEGQVLMHSFVVGEVSLRNLHHRRRVLDGLKALPKAVIETEDEVQLLIESHHLFGRGIGYVDAHLLTSVRLTDGARLWTRDKRLHAVAAELGLSAPDLRH